jgi:hypothetical protein
MRFQNKMARCQSALTIYRRPDITICTTDGGMQLVHLETMGKLWTPQRREEWLAWQQENQLAMIKFREDNQKNWHYLFVHEAFYYEVALMRPKTLTDAINDTNRFEKNAVTILNEAQWTKLDTVILPHLGMHFRDDTGTIRWEKITILDDEIALIRPNYHRNLICHHHTTVAKLRHALDVKLKAMFPWYRRTHLLPDEWLQFKTVNEEKLTFIGDNPVKKTTNSGKTQKDPQP